MGSLRRNLLTRPIFAWAKTALPVLSATEREAIEAGDVWWDGDLFGGNPNWQKLLDEPPAKLSAEERAFMDGPVEELCGMLDDWKINWELRDLPPEVWAYLKKHKFFAMIIPKEFGGLGFSALAHSEVVRKISTRSVAAAVTAMVPNSLGPGELLMRFGTKEQQDHWLPRLADGREIPCFGLTSPEAGSDAAAMIDTGIVCKGSWQGRETLGIRLNWKKRYITLAPVATVVGLAFKLYDPDHLLGDREELGITLALIPANTPGVSIGRRHLPSMHVFMNGPIEGHDVFVPLDAIIGGAARAGQGWRMLMSALAAGRSISLPSQSAAGAAFAAHVTGAYARIRVQFNIAIGQFEAIQERLARMAATAYMLDGARRMSCAAIDRGHHPAVVSAIMKSQATDRLRIVANDAMDIHGGKAVIDGPHNYLGSLYRSVPIGITVEGANILTRSLIQFGQGSIRSHPYLLREVEALQNPDREQALAEFDKAFWSHVGHTVMTLIRATTRAWLGSMLAPAPNVHRAQPYYRRLGRYAASFALVADFALLTLGGALKRKEMLSGRFGDMLSELFLASAVLKRWHDEGSLNSDYALVEYNLEAASAAFEQAMDAILSNLPNRFVAFFLRLCIMPFGVLHRGPKDSVTQACARILLEPSASRSRLTADIAHGRGDDGVARLERAFKLTVDTASAREKLRKGHLSIADGLAKGVLNEVEAAQLRAADEAVALAIAVDDFAQDELAQMAIAPSASVVAQR